MGLTLEAEQRMEKVGLVEFFDKRNAIWLAVAKKNFAFVKDQYPPESPIRRDDVQRVIIPILAVNEELREYLDTKKLRGKFWIMFFADLIIERTWDEIRGES